ncbi:MAG: hypothetical protein ABIE42_09415 [Candidatus Eisenbacteria bacterium]
MTLGGRHVSLSVLVVVLTAVALTAASPARADETEPAPLAHAGADSVTSPEEEVPRESPPGGDVRRVGVSGMDAVVALPPGVRRVGSGWDGHRASFARGVLPAALTEVTLRGRRAADWIDGGLDLLAVGTPAAGVLLVPAGHDLSVWPVLTAEWPDVLLGGAAPLAVDLRPLRRPATVPFSRLTAASGPFGRSLLGAEFGRGYSGGSALTGFFETEDGRAPSAGGSYGIDRAGGSALLDLSGGWTAEVGGVRVALDRSRPTPDVSVPSLTREYVRTDLFARGFAERVRLEIFHTQSWLESVSFGGEARAEVDGLSAGLRQVGPVDAVRLQLERRAVSGGLLSEAQEETGFHAEVADTLRMGTNSVSVILGAHVLGDDVVPQASAAVTGERSRPDLWRFEVSLWGRHPTALERALAPRPLSGTNGNAGQIGGSRLVGPERAVAMSATYVRRDLLAGVGARGELVRVVGPIALDEYEALRFVPANAADETGGVLSVWAAAGDTSGPSGGFDVSFLGLDAEGALNGLTPVPSVAARASASMPFGLFEDYLRTRVTAALEFEYGLARGPWSGLIDDARASVSLVVTGAVGSARLFVALDDVLAGDHARVPGMEPGGTTLAAGFSWCFRD